MLSPELFRRAEELFHRLVDAPAAERERALRNLAESEPDLAEELARLLGDDTRRRAGEEVIAALAQRSVRQRSRSAA